MRLDCAIPIFIAACMKTSLTLGVPEPILKVLSGDTLEPEGENVSETCRQKECDDDTNYAAQREQVSKWLFRK
jgi:hypothetical protein